MKRSDVIQIIQQVLSSIRQSYEESVVEENFVSMSSKTLIKKFIQHFVLQIGKNEHKSKSGEQYGVQVVCNIVVDCIVIEMCCLCLFVQ